jgi:uncharacterized membrane protein
MRGWPLLIIGLVVFVGPHAFVTQRAWRAAVIARIGERPYKGIFAVLSLIGLILIGEGYGQYRAAGKIYIWHPPLWTHYVTQALMWPASILVVAAYIRGEIWRTIRHPLLLGVKTWALAHLISNGDLGSIVLFGTFLLWGGLHRLSYWTRSDAGAPPIPASGRHADWTAIAVGTVLFLALGFIFHPLVVGTSVFGRPAF